MGHLETAATPSTSIPDKYVDAMTRGNYELPQRLPAIVLQLGNRMFPDLVSGSMTWSRFHNSMLTEEQLRAQEVAAYAAHAHYGISEVADERVATDLPMIFSNAKTLFEHIVDTYAALTLSGEPMTPDERPGMLSYDEGGSPHGPHLQDQYPYPREVLFSRTEGHPRIQAQALVEVWHAGATAMRDRHYRKLSDQFRRNYSTYKTSKPRSLRHWWAGKAVSRADLGMKQHVTDTMMDTLPAVGARTGYTIPNSAMQGVLETLYTRHQPHAKAHL